MDSRWVAYLPPFLRSKVAGRPNLQKILNNTGWLFFDKILRLGVGLLVGVWVARYLGPDQFGLWNYTLAFTALFGAFATLGLDSIVVRELVKYPEQQDIIMGSAFRLKLVGGILAMLSTVLAITVMRTNDQLVRILVTLSAVGFIFQSLNVIDYYFQAKVKSRYTVYATNGAFSLITLVKIALVLKAAPLVAFAWAGLAEIVLTTFFLCMAFRLNHQHLRAWRYDKHIVKNLLKDSWPLIFSGLAVAIFMKIDQIMLEELLDSHAVGIYAAATRISEVWYFLGTIFVNSASPSIYSAKTMSPEKYVANLQRIFDLMVILAMAIIVPLSLCAPFVVNLLYGAAYGEASKVLMVHIWATLFVFTGIAQGVFWIAENLQKFALLLTFSAAAINIIMNFVLIPRLGAMGAALATLISYGIPTILLPYVLKETRPVFFAFFRALNIFRYTRIWHA